MNNNKKKIVTILLILLLVFTIIGGTFAYWSWQTTDAQKTNVTFTVTREFSCSADGGGNITSNDKMLAPAACTNPTYAIKRQVKASVTNNQNGNIYLEAYN